MAIAAMISMIATTISNSIKEKPRELRIRFTCAFPPFLLQLKCQSQPKVTRVWFGCTSGLHAAHKPLGFAQCGLRRDTALVLANQKAKGAPDVATRCSRLVPSPRYFANLQLLHRCVAGYAGTTRAARGRSSPWRNESYNRIFDRAETLYAGCVQGCWVRVNDV